MKSIEERARAKFPESAVRAHRCEVALRELAADLQAEKEKEVAELRRERDLAIAHDRQPYPTAHAYEKVCEALNKVREEKDTMSATIAQQDALLDEVKRVLAYAIDGLERFHSEVLSWKDEKVVVRNPAQNHLHIHQALNQLLTRLGGSHE